MMRLGRLFALISLSVIPVFLVSTPAVGQEHETHPSSATVHDEEAAHVDAVHEDEHHEGATHEFHQNHFGGFLGAS